MDATWDIYSHVTRLGLVVLTSVAPDPEIPEAACQLEVWPADPGGRIAGDLLWNHEFSAGRQGGAFRPLVAAERHLALAGALTDYQGGVPRQRRDLTHLLRRLADPVAERHAATDLLAATTTVVALSYVEEWGALITTAVDGTAAVTSIGPGTPDYAHADGVPPWWTLRYDPSLAGKEHASLLNAFATTPPAADVAPAAAALAEQTSLAFWVHRFRVEQQARNPQTPGPVEAAPTVPTPASSPRRALVTPVPAWSLRLVTTEDPAGARTSAQHLGLADEGTELWRVTHPATAWPEDAHEDLVALLTRYEQHHDLPAATQARRALAAALLRQWWEGPAVSAAPAAPRRSGAPNTPVAPAAPASPAETTPFPSADSVGLPPLEPTPGWHYGVLEGARWVLWRDPQQPGERLQVATLRDHAGWPRIWASAERLVSEAQDHDINPTEASVPDLVRRKVDAALKNTVPRPTAAATVSPTRPVPPHPGGSGL